MKIILKFVGIAALALFATPTLAVTCNWNKRVGGKIDEASNWYQSQLPGEEDTAYFRYPQSAELTIDADKTVSIIRFGSSGTQASAFDGSLALGEERTLMATNSVQFYAGSRVVLASGTIKTVGSADARIRLGDGLNETNEVNTLIVKGSGSHLETASKGCLDIGYVVGRNIVSIEEGASFTGSVIVASRAISTNNIIRVTGSGSTLTVPSTATTAPVLGVSGSGNVLEILDGGKVLFDLSGKYFNIGSSNSYGAGSNNWVHVSGSGSSFEDKTTLYVGYASNANFNGMAVEEGATATLGSALYIANNANSVSNRVVVSGSGSTLTVGGGTYIGANNQSETDGNILEVLDGAAFTASSTIQLGTRGNGCELFVSNATASVTGGIVMGVNGGKNSILHIAGESPSVSLSTQINIYSAQNFVFDIPAGGWNLPDSRAAAITCNKIDFKTGQESPTIKLTVNANKAPAGRYVLLEAATTDLDFDKITLSEESSDSVSLDTSNKRQLAVNVNSSGMVMIVF